MVIMIALPFIETVNNNTCGATLYCIVGCIRLEMPSLKFACTSFTVNIHLQYGNKREKITLLSLPGSIKNCLGDLTSGRAFDNGCCCFDSEEARCNSLRGKTVECHCGVSPLFAYTGERENLE